jgi:hypothetical protein
VNIVYGIKIFVALSICAGITRFIAGRGLRSVLDDKDFKYVWIGIVGTLAVCCFSVRVGLFFVTFPLWVLFLANSLGKNGSGRLPAYALLCCISPPMFVQVEHIGPLNDLIRLTPFRILSIVLFVPEALRLASRRNTAPNPSWLTFCDFATFGYAVYWLVAHFSGLSISSFGREVIGQLLDSLLPYYVLTRACIDTAVRRRFLGFLLAGATFESVVGLVESLSGHYLYTQLQWLYNVSWAQATNLMRGSWLRAEAAFPGPLALAVLLTFGIGVWFALKKPEKNRPYLVVVLLLFGGLLATYGRGPVLASLLLLASVAMLRRMPARRFLVAMIIGTIVVSVGWQAGIGDAILSVVTSASSGDAGADFNLLYRQELLSTSLALIKQSPWFGVPNFTAQMENLRQGEGIIDLVNTYLVVALNSGMLGIVLVFAPWGVTLWREAGHVTSDTVRRREGLAWLALTIAVMAAIFTVSPISIIQPVMVWTVALALARLQDGRQQSSAGPVHAGGSNLHAFPVTNGIR